MMLKRRTIQPTSLLTRLNLNVEKLYSKRLRKGNKADVGKKAWSAKDRELNTRGEKLVRFLRENRGCRDEAIRPCV